MNTSKETKVVEPVRTIPAPEFPSVGLSGSMVPAPMSALMAAGAPDGIEKMVAQAERYYALLDRIRNAAVRGTRPHQWLDEDGSPYLTIEGTMQVANGYGVQVQVMERRRDEYTDDKGTFYIFSVSGRASWLNSITSQIGTCSTRDAFFGKRQGEYLPLSEVDIPSVMKKAETNFLNRILKAQLGLDFTWDELEAISSKRITREVCVGVKHDRGSKGGKTAPTPQTITEREQIRKMLNEMCQGDAELAKTILRDCTTFKKKDGDQFPGFDTVERISEGAIKYAAANVRKRYAEYKANNTPMEYGA